MVQVLWDSSLNSLNTDHVQLEVVLKGLDQTMLWSRAESQSP